MEISLQIETEIRQVLFNAEEMIIFSVHAGL